MEKDGSYTDMNAAFSDGFMSFITDHLSVYVMVAEKNLLEQKRVMIKQIRGIKIMKIK